MQPGASLGIVDARLRDGKPGIKSLRLAVKSRPGSAINVQDVKIHVYFYEQNEEQDVVLTESKVVPQWLSPPVDWTSNEPELLEVQYTLPDSELPGSAAANGAPGRKYFGYIVGVFYNNELQDFRSDPASLAKDFPAPALSQGRRRMNILIVDDEPGLAAGLAGWLEENGWGSPGVATTSDEAVEWINRNGRVDVLVCDVAINPADGFTLRETIQPHLPKMRTIFISGYDLSDHSARMEGCHFLAKPVTGEALDDAIRSLFEAKSPKPSAGQLKVPPKLFPATTGSPPPE